MRRLRFDGNRANISHAVKKVPREGSLVVLTMGVGGGVFGGYERIPGSARCARV